MKEVQGEQHSAQISPSNGKETRRSLWHPFSSNRPTLTPAEYVNVQLAKEADKKRPHKNSMPQRMLYMVRRHPFHIPLILAGIGLSSYAIHEELSYLFKENNNNPVSRERDTNLETGIPKIVREDKAIDNRPAIPTAVPAETKSEGNTIWMTREEYEKIAPPAIDRTNVKEVPMTLNITPGSDGRTTRKLTLEQGTTVNAMIYVKTPDGNIREVSKTKITDHGGVTGASPVGFTFPNCQTFLGLKGEIQAGDKLPAPITGRVYYQGDTLEDYKRQTKGKVIIDYQGQTKGKVIADYIIEGEYYDEKTGKTFKTIAGVRMWRGITEPLIQNIPNRDDEAFKEKARGIDSSGKEVEVMVTNKDKIPVVMVQQGEDLFKFITKPTVQKSSSDSKIKFQLVVSTSYQGDLDENGIGDTFGGEDCKHPTVDNKEIVLK